MITKLNVASIYVLDKEEALDFYVNKLGLEVGNDIRQGTYRWLTVRVPGGIRRPAPNVVSTHRPSERCVAALRQEAPFAQLLNILGSAFHDPLGGITGGLAVDLHGSAGEPEHGK